MNEEEARARLIPRAAHDSTGRVAAHRQKDGLVIAFRVPLRALIPEGVVATDFGLVGRTEGLPILSQRTQAQRARQRSIFLTDPSDVHLHFAILSYSHCPDEDVRGRSPLS